MRLAARLSPFLISFAVTCTFYINLCAWIFKCGCRSLWAGADAACNIHALHGKHCPWCSHGQAGYAIVMVLLCAPQLAVSLWPRWSWPVRIAAAVALFPAIGAVVALAFGWLDGYW
ncbi:MAG: hypothetical protein DMG59_17730 [Acidobacteria bacterium]|nr:MAG: hypothetical protein DMG59_17730 [Acidobacteriota bacterium]